MSVNTSSIMYTDVVGYSKLTGDNQELALIILEEHNEILKKYTEEYSGNTVKLTGDGLCALFDNPIDSVKCAIDIQLALYRRNQLNTKERQVRIRIGLHYGAYEYKNNDVFGDAVNIAKNIEPIAPYGGIAISDVLSDLVSDEGNIYIREYKVLQLGDSQVKTYEVFLDLLTWLKNKNKQSLHTHDSEKMYIKAHNCFHDGDYSSAIKFAAIALESKSKNYNEIESFICNTLISLGELNYAKKMLSNIKLNCKDDLKLQAHIYKMEGHLSLNNSDLNSAKDLFFQSLQLMQKTNTRYVNELIYNVCITLLYNDENDQVISFLEQVIDVENDQYLLLVEGLKILTLDSISANILESYIHKINSSENSHFISLGFRVVTLIYIKIKNYNKAQEAIDYAQKKLKLSSKNISDSYQRKSFLEDVYVHRDIMNLSNKISDYFVEMTYNEVKDDNIDSEIIIDSSFCTNCGFKNKKKFNFCVSCGNKL